MTGAGFVFGMVAELAGYRAMFALASVMPVAAWFVLFLFGMEKDTKPAPMDSPG